MVNSSPKYAITKAVVDYQSRKRDRPLRTYGKNTISTPDSRNEPEAKKRRTDTLKLLRPSHSDSWRSTDTVQPASGSQGSEGRNAPRATQPAPANKGSILSYFKPLEATHKIKGKTEVEPASKLRPDATTSRLRSSARRKPRLLRIRTPANQRDEEGTESPNNNRSSGNENACKIAASDQRDPLLDRGQDLLNRPQDHESLCSEGQTKGHNRRLGMRFNASPTVQTTLNISTQAAFSECKVCDTVWNPLYPDDVKYHMKRHATVLRAEKKKAAEVL